MANRRQQRPEKAGEFMIGNDLRVTRLGFGAMRITGKGIWGEPADRAVAIRVLRGINFIDRRIPRTLAHQVGTLRQDNVSGILSGPNASGAWLGGSGASLLFLSRLIDRVLKYSSRCQRIVESISQRTPALIAGGSRI
jgi:hypothetical protein